LAVLARISGGALDEELIVAYRASRALRYEGVPFLPDLTDSSIRTRRAELVTLGHVRDSGHKRATARGNPATVWEAVPPKTPTR
jgi:hypothetical protein